MRKKSYRAAVAPGEADPAAFAENVRRGLALLANRPQPGVPWRDGANLPWDDPLFSERMLAEQLDQSHGAGSRRAAEIAAQVEALWGWLKPAPGANVLDVTCGPGLYAAHLAGRGCRVLGIDFSPAAIAYAREQARAAGFAAKLDYRQADVREALATLAPASFDAALFLYGQFTVFRPAEGAALLDHCARALRPGGRLVLEVLDYTHLDKTNSTWWFTGHGGLWGDFEHLHLGEREWDADRRAVLERFYVLNLETGALQAYGLSDQAYTEAAMREMLAAAGFSAVEVYPAWGGVTLYDADEWSVYVAEKGRL